MGYFWIRVYDYSRERDGHEKGTLLDEFYLNDATDREAAKRIVQEKYALTKTTFSKPKKCDSGIYALVLDSDKFFYDRFNTFIDTLCFGCHKIIKGKASEFPRAYIGSGDGYTLQDNEFEISDKTAHFCTYDCKRHFNNSINPIGEGEFQEKEPGQHGDIFGYIYLIYNRAMNIYYIGQTRYMPFFRWQEHVKDGAKGDVSDLTFSVLVEVRRAKLSSDEENQKYLNSLESWWIEKYKTEGYHVFNISKPKITIEHLKSRFNEMIARESQVELSV